MNRFYIQHDRDAGLPYIRALEKSGDVMVRDFQRADYLILDRNWREALPKMAWARENGRPIFLIPHGSRGFMFWDSIYEDIDMGFDCYLLPAEGHRRILEGGGFGVPMVVTGFPWCRVKEFQGGKLERVLFAPIHPDPEGKWTWAEQWLKFNSAAWDKLLAERGDYRLTVYHNHSPETNGLTLVEGVEYVESTLQMGDALRQIDEADLVIAQETFASLAIARGKPTVMIDDLVIPPAPLGEVSKYWPAYEGEFAYPFNLLREDDVQALFRRAMEPSPEVLTWKRNFIGGNFDEVRFLAAIHIVKRTIGAWQGLRSEKN